MLAQSIALFLSFLYKDQPGLYSLPCGGLVCTLSPTVTRVCFIVVAQLSYLLVEFCDTCAGSVNALAKALWCHIFVSNRRHCAAYLDTQATNYQLSPVSCVVVQSARSRHRVISSHKGPANGIKCHYFYMRQCSCFITGRITSVPEINLSTRAVNTMKQIY